MQRLVIEHQFDALLELGFPAEDFGGYLKTKAPRRALGWFVWCSPGPFTALSSAMLLMFDGRIDAHVDRILAATQAIIGSFA